MAGDGIAIYCWSDLWEKSGEIEVIRKVKSFRTDTRLIRKKTIIQVNPSKNNSTESYILLEPIQIPPVINSNFLPSQSTAPEESLVPIFVASEQGLDASA